MSDSDNLFGQENLLGISLESDPTSLLGIEASPLGTNKEVGLFTEPLTDEVLLENSTANLISQQSDTLDDSLVGNGLVARYYDNQDFTNLVAIRQDPTIDFDWGKDAPLTGVSKNSFSVRWSGQVEARYSETYTFSTQSDDGVRLWVNGELIIDDWHNHGVKERSGTVTLEAGQLYDIKLEYYENKGKAVAKLLWSSDSQSKEIVPESSLYASLPEPVEPGNGNGLTARYFNNKDFTDLGAIRTDSTVNFDWQRDAPVAGIDKNSFSVRWSGELEAQYSEIYTFYTQSDDGVRLWVNGELLIDDWQNHRVKERSASIALEAGQLYDIKLEYYENRGKAVAKLLWSSDSQSKEIVPSSQLYSDLLEPKEVGNGTGLQAEYFDNKDLTDLVLTRTDSTVDFDWQKDAPTAELGKNTFSVRWSGFVQPQFDEVYSFYTQSDDGVRLWVNGELLIDDWQNHRVKERSGNIALEAGKLYDIKLEYYENRGKAVAKLLWSSDSQVKQIIPASQLYPERNNLAITAALASDTGVTNDDGITFDPTITGEVTGNNDAVSLQGQFVGVEGDPIDLSDALQLDGSFELSLAQLATINGGTLADGSYSLKLIASDGNGQPLESLVSFTLDRSAPELSLLTPLEEGEHSSQARLIGEVTPGDSLEYSLDDSTALVLEPDELGQFDHSLADLESGQHNLTVTARDLAGNITNNQLNFQVTNDFFIGSNATAGWGAKNSDTIIFGEQDSLVTQTTMSIDLGLAIDESGEPKGTRTLQFDVETFWDHSDLTLQSDQLLVYLLDPANPSQTLLDNGTEGTAVFTLAGEEAEFTPGLVNFDGTTVTIDLTSLSDLTEGLLVFQLLNQDGDNGTRVQINNFNNSTDLEGIENPIFNQTNHLALAGSALDLTRLNPSSEVAVTINNVRLDPDSGEYQAEIQVSNQGPAIGRNVAVVFNDLLEGVALVNPSGTDELGNPYINLRNAIRPGGLEMAAVSDSVAITFTNPHLQRFSIQTTVLVGSTNVAPLLEPIDNLTVTPGEKLSIALTATDPDGDTVTYKIESDAELPRGMLAGDGTLKFNPSPDEIGSYQFTLIATDGAAEVRQSVNLDVVADPITTTRISGIIQNVAQQPLAGVVIELGDLQTMTNAQGEFTLETDQPLTADTLKIRGEEIEGDLVYPFIAEKLPLVLGQEVYQGFNNVIERPIYLPALDVASGQVIDPNVDNTVTTENIPGAAVFVAANSLEDQSGAAFTDILSITEVPPELTPAALPQNLSPDLVVTIQPGEMLFNTPAPLSLPNRAGWAAGMEMDLWSINPETGDFDKVGIGRVSDDGSVVETVDGGIRNSSWHFFAPEPIAPPENNTPPPTCDECQETANFKSEVELHSGAVIENYDLVDYSSNGENRGISLTYDSLRADPRPIFQFGYADIDPQQIAPGLTNNLRLMADLTIRGHGFDYQLPGYEGGEFAIVDEGKHFWSLPDQAGNIKMGLQADLRDWESGKYNFVLNNGTRIYVPPLNGNPARILGSSSDYEDQILHVNSIDSAFGSGWGIDGWQEIVENHDGSLLLIDGDGGELWFEAPKNEGEAYGNPSGDFSLLEKLTDGTFRRTMKDQMVYKFNSNNQLESVTDPKGNSTQYIYNDQQQLIQIIDPVSLTTILTYNIAGKVTSITDPANRETLLEYDNNGNLIEITNPDGSSHRWEYDAEHHMIAEIDPNNNRAEARYDQFGRATEATQEDGSVVKVNPIQTQGLYSPEATTRLFLAPTALLTNKGLKATYADGNGQVVATELDLSGQRVTAVNGGGATSKIERNEDNLIDSRTNARGNFTDYTYDERGNVIAIAEQVFSAGSATESNQEYLFSDPLYRTGFWAEYLASGDINQDGYLDIVTANRLSSENISVLLGNEDGNFNSRIDYDIASYPSQVLLEDINSDTNLDLILFGRSTSSISISLGNGDGTFEANSYLQTGDTIKALKIHDLNNDGNLDLITVNYQGIISQLLGNGNGDFSLLTEYNLDLDALGVGVNNIRHSSKNSITFQDFDLDSDWDLVIGNYQASQPHVAIFLNNNDGTFSFQANVPVGELISSAVKVDSEDVNGDNIPDLVASYGYYQRQLDISRMETTILLGNGDGTFELETNYQLNNTRASIAAQSLKDLNQDGIFDLITSNDKEVHIRLGHEDGSFSEPESYLIGVLIESLIVEDLNHDGYLDLAGVDGRENISIQYGNGDGSFGVQPPEVISELSIYQPIFQDINNDGLSDIISQKRYKSPGDENIISVALGNGDGSFSETLDIDIGTSFNSFIIDYIDNDEYLDLAIVYSRRIYPTAETIVSIFPGIGNGTFGANTDYSLGYFDYSSISLIGGDINSDGSLDLVTYHPDGASILLNNGDGIFTNTVVNLDSPYFSSLVDIDTDGDLDLVGNYSSFNIAYNDGLGNFGTETTTALPLEDDYEIRDFKFEDLDGDHDLDLVASLGYDYDGTNYIGIWLSNGDGSFQSQMNYQFGEVDYNPGIPYNFALGDVNLDGIIDLIAGRVDLNSEQNTRSSTVSLALGNGDGTFSRETHYAILGDTSSIDLNDLDNDGDLDVLFGYRISYYDGPAVPSSGITAKINQINKANNSSGLSQTAYTYDPKFNQVTSVTDELGRITLYDIDPNNGNLLSITRVVGEIGGDDDVIESYTYTAAGLVDTMTDPLGRVTDYDYDLYGRLIQTISAQGTEDEAVIGYEYDAAGNQTAIIDANGNRTEFKYDELNRLIKSTYAVGTIDEAVETIEYDRAGNQIATVDGNGNRTEFIYDEKNRLIQTIAPDPDGAGELTSPVTIHTYDKNGNLIGIIDPLGRKTRYVYDSRNRLVETILPDGTVRQSRYDLDNNLTSSINAAGDSSNRQFDARSRLVSETDAQGNITRYRYDAANQLVGIVDGNRNLTSYEYDELGRQILVRDALGNETRTEYDLAGNVVATIDANGNRTEYRYDERNRQVEIIDAELGVTTTEYDGVGNLVSITDPVINITSYQYDARNRLVLETNELGYTRSFEYDDVGNQISLTDRNNRTRSFEYDGLNRQIAENWLDNLGNSIRTTTSEYDAASQLLATFDPDSAYRFSYDLLGRLSTVDNAGTPGVPNVVLTYDYDDKGNIISVSDIIDGVAGAITAYSYDQLDRVDQITQSGNNVTDKRVDFTYDAIGQYESISRYSDLEGANLVVDSSFTYDKANRLTNLTHSNSSDDLAFYNLAYDAASRITQIVDLDGTHDYDYDKRNQLTAAAHSDENNADESYDYDANGNRVSSSLHGSDYV